MKKLVGGAAMPGYIIPPRPFFTPTVDKYTVSEMGSLIPMFFKLWIRDLTGRRNIQWLTSIKGA